MAISDIRLTVPRPADMPAPPGPARRVVPLAALVALLTLPSLTVMPQGGVDFSWAAALHLAAHHRLAFGSGVVFTYGPLGFLSVPIAYFRATWALSVAYVCAVQLALCLVLMAGLKRSLGLPLATVTAFVLATVSRVLGPTEVALAVFVAAGVLVLARAEAETVRHERLLIGLAGAVAGFHLLVKFNTGIAMLVVGTIAVSVLGRRWWRSEGLFWGAAAVSFVAGWLLSGNVLGDLGVYLARSVQVASGYSEAMGTEAPGRSWEYVLAVAVVGVMAALVWLGTQELSRRRRVATVLATGAWLFLALKHGFVRHDSHSVVFFEEAAIVATALCRSAAWRLHTLAAVCVLALGVLAVNSSAPPGLVDPRPDPLSAFRDAATVLAPHRLAERVDRARAQLQRRYALSPTTLAALAGHSVHIYPMEAGVAWAYPQLDWQPLPVFQAYTAYTAGLDAANAAMLSGPNAPERILASAVAIDGRDPGWESPAARLAMACHYTELGIDGRWQVLARVPNRCGPAQSLGTVDIVAGQAIPVPTPVGPDELVVARIDGLDTPLAYRVRSQLSKLPVVTAVLDGKASYRLVPGTAGDGLVLSAPTAALGWSGPFAYPAAVSSIEVRGGGWGVGTRLRVEFLAVHVSTAG